MTIVCSNETVILYDIFNYKMCNDVVSLMEKIGVYNLLCFRNRIVTLVYDKSDLCTGNCPKAFHV